MDINEFRSSINTLGILKTNKFEVSFGFRTGHYLQGDPAINQNTLTLRCDSATLPGVSLASYDGPPRLGYGPAEKHPYSSVFEDLTLTFIVDAGSQVHRMLYKWINCIVNFQGIGASTLNTDARGFGSSRARAYEVGYRDKYDATLELHVYRDTGDLAMTFKAYNTFPMGFPQSSMNWNEGDILRLSIPFAYTDYSVEYADRPLRTGTAEVTPLAASTT